MLIVAAFTIATPIAISARGSGSAFHGAERSLILAVMARNTGIVPMMTGGTAAPAS
uniref:hypothetical protein n=1 Tax=Agrobacterium tumefaciens complex TaxID=1183400 RepID=UPI000321B0FE|nr:MULTISPECIES: hypothetical protein [Agrobacterium tumefaciens complex]